MLRICIVNGRGSFFYSTGSISSLGSQGSVFGFYANQEEEIPKYQQRGKRVLSATFVRVEESFASATTVASRIMLTSLFCPLRFLEHYRQSRRPGGRQQPYQTSPRDHHR